MITKCTILLIVCVTSSICISEADLEIKTSYGTFTAQDRKNHLAFEGIPYAQPPLSELRFEPPVPVAKSPEETFVFNSTDPCAQWDPFSKQIVGSEDCLYLNVYKPKTTTNKSLLPVIFHIHGGAWEYGNCKQYGEKILMVNQDLIFVNFNYRVGIFGFLASGDEVIPGNMGFKDQALALRWVRENIEAFGGDRDNIIITGFSAGAASVHLFYLSPMTQGNFAAGISHSGHALNNWVVNKNYSQKYAAILDAVDCQKEDKNKNLQCLRAQSVETLIKAHGLLKKFQGFPAIIFGLNIEPESDHAFMTETPLNLMKKGEVAKKPWLMSITQDEGAYLTATWSEDAELFNYMNENWNDVAPIMFSYDWVSSQDEKNNISQKIKEHYIKSDKLDLSKFQGLTDAFGDRYFGYRVPAALQYQAALTPTYFYQFNFKGNYGLGEFVSDGKNLGIVHGEDIQFAYSTPFRKDVPFSENEEKMSDIMVSMYEMMAKTGIPKMLDHEFPPTSYDTHGNVHLLQVNSPEDIQTVSFPHSVYREASFWENLIKEIDEIV